MSANVRSYGCAPFEIVGDQGLNVHVDHLAIVVDTTPGTYATHKVAWWEASAEMTNYSGVAHTGPGRWFVHLTGLGQVFEVGRLSDGIDEVDMLSKGGRELNPRTKLAVDMILNYLGEAMEKWA